MLRLAVTGGIACGKSLVGSFLQAEAVPVCDADDLAHKTMEPGSSTYQEVLNAFGQGILGQDKKIDRAILGAEVFSDINRLACLNAIVHPVVRQAWQSWLDDQGPTVQAAAVIIPLFFEIGEERQKWDAIVCVGAGREDQRRRLRDRGLSDSEADARIASQASLQEKMEKSDYVVFNGSSVDALKKQTLMLLRALLES